jgi:hypothetical protein
MAIVLRDAAATNYNKFAGGDSILKSATLVGAYLECQALLLRAYKAYNQENGDVLLPEPEVSSDDNTGINSCSVSMPYRKTGAVKRATDYINAYAGWVTPTAGELFENIVGGGTPIDNLSDAFLYLAEAVDYGFSKTIKVIGIEDLKPLMAVTDDGNSRTVTSTMPYNVFVDPADGTQKTVANNLLVLLDLQENLPLV